MRNRILPGIVAFSLLAALGAYPLYAAKITGGGSGNVTGAASSTDDAIVRFDGTGGKTIQNSGVTIDDNGNLVIGGDIVGTGTNKLRNNTGSLFMDVLGSTWRIGATGVIEDGSANPLVRVVDNGTVGDLIVTDDVEMTAGNYIGISGGSATIFQSVNLELYAGGAVVADVTASGLQARDGKYISVQTDAGAPAAGDCDADGEAGRLSLDTSNNRLYVCNGLARGWDFIALTD